MFDLDQGYEEVELTPFIHQVGGHTCVLQVSPEIVCKPYIENEAAFYNNIPESLKEFVPYFRGVIGIHCNKSQDGISFHAKVPTKILESLQGKLAADSETGNDDVIEGEITNDSHSIIKKGLGTWNLECVRRQIERYGYWVNDAAQNFMMLENLLTSYEYPCVMDLKLGTVSAHHSTGQHSDRKRKLMEDRWSKSTSASLGFRICGIQTYKADTNRYIAKDKYHGRNLDEAGVRQELTNFFHNGVFLRRDVITAIACKLSQLCSALESKSSFKLFSCSLLVIYEGATEDVTCDSLSTNRLSTTDQSFGENSEAKVDIRLIDFANAVLETKLSEEQRNLDSGIRLGIQKLSQLLQDISKLD